MRARLAGIAAGAALLTTGLAIGLRPELGPDDPMTVDDRTPILAAEPATHPLEAVTMGMLVEGAADDDVVDHVGEPFAPMRSREPVPAVRVTLVADTPLLSRIRR